MISFSECFWAHAHNWLWLHVYDLCIFVCMCNDVGVVTPENSFAGAFAVLPCSYRCYRCFSGVARWWFHQASSRMGPCVTCGIARHIPLSDSSDASALGPQHSDFFIDFRMSLLQASLSTAVSGSSPDLSRQAPGPFAEMPCIFYAASCCAIFHFFPLVQCQLLISIALE